MPFDEPDETDPLLLVGVELPADEAAHLESARVFAEEFARQGFDETALMALFRDPFYLSPHRAFLALGEEKTRGLAREYADFWGRVSWRDRDSDPETGMVMLPVLDEALATPRRNAHG